MEPNGSLPHQPSVMSRAGSRSLLFVARNSSIVSSSSPLSRSGSRAVFDDVEGEGEGDARELREVPLSHSSLDSTSEDPDTAAIAGLMNPQRHDPNDAILATLLREPKLPNRLEVVTDAPMSFVKQQLERLASAPPGSGGRLPPSKDRKWQGEKLLSADYRKTVMEVLGERPEARPIRTTKGERVVVRNVRTGLPDRWALDGSDLTSTGDTVKPSSRPSTGRPSSRQSMNSSIGGSAGGTKEVEEIPESFSEYYFGGDEDASASRGGDYCTSWYLPRKYWRRVNKRQKEELILESLAEVGDDMALAELAYSQVNSRVQTLLQAQESEAQQAIAKEQERAKASKEKMDEDEERDEEECESRESKSNDVNNVNSGKGDLETELERRRSSVNDEESNGDQESEGDHHLKADQARAEPIGKANMEVMRDLSSQREWVARATAARATLSAQRAKEDLVRSQVAVSYASQAWKDYLAKNGLRTPYYLA